MISFTKYKKIAFVWGGTGGHVTPIVALVHEHAHVNLDYLWIGGKDSLESTEATKEKIRFFPIQTLKLSTVWSPKVLMYPFVLLRGIFQARAVLLAEKPDIVFSKWGPGSVAVGIASWMLMIPLWIHESDTIPGWSNRFLWLIAERIFLGFDTARKQFADLKCTVVWQIIDPEIRKPPKDYRYWKTTKNHILVICGSQGSKNIFRAISENCRHLDVEWIVLLGILNKDARDLFAGFQNITLYDWIDAHTLGSILNNTDLVITRGSATSLAEIDLYKKRKIIVPLPWSAQNHQYHNAVWYKENRDDIILEDHDMKDKLQKTITDTLSGDIIGRTMERSDDFLR
jgi:UDP-N-acetylglucosamine--N-acetylmuramyl-(pentapeptide) pyrophosphoryl-undecaprenol N-acetylglucosamine transferase